MTTRGKRLVSMVSQKDKITLGQLDLNKPLWDTTQCSNIRNIEDISNLKKTLLCDYSESAVVPELHKLESNKINIISSVNIPSNDLKSTIVLSHASVNQMMIPQKDDIDLTKTFFYNENTASPGNLNYSPSLINPQDNYTEQAVKENLLQQTIVDLSCISISPTNSKLGNLDCGNTLNVLSSESQVEQPTMMSMEYSPQYTNLTNVCVSYADSNNPAFSTDTDLDKLQLATECSSQGVSYDQISNSTLDDDSGSEYQYSSPEYSSDTNSESSVDSKSGGKNILNELEQAKLSVINKQREQKQSSKPNNAAKFNERGEVKSSVTNLRGKLKRDKKEHCVYCEKNVTNFSRHLTRIHNKEFEVTKLLSLPSKSKQRKFLIDEIRKRGNFINSFGNMGFINPVRRPKAYLQKKPSDYLPCNGCKGFFSRTYLHRHIKKCYKKSESTGSKCAQANGLTLLYLSNNNKFDDLKMNVFPHMHSDEITKTVMNDYLIKCFGQRYYKCHKEKHLINTVSQRMRELARFFIILQKGEHKLHQLVDYLKPCYFDNLVNATNEMSGYKEDKDTFQSPSLALRWATVLKQICDIAIFLAEKEENAIKREQTKTLKNMIETQFRFFVSTNAHKDLSAKKWKKGSMLPLTEDIIKMNEFVVNEEEKWSTLLQNDCTNLTYVRNLTEIILAHLILLNRKRSGEAQRITIDDYLREEDKSTVQDIFQSLSFTEKVLINNVKRFTIRGKRGRSVPVIFTKTMQEHTNVLLESRKFVASSNPYLFANPNTSNSFIWSYKVLKKIASVCNVSNIEAITATCLRKHIATIAQLISMDNNDLEQLSNHLGHEKATHLNYYRKTDDKLQIAKVSKLLLLMEQKSMGEYRGKSIEDIDLEIPSLDDTEKLNEKEELAEEYGGEVDNKSVEVAENKQNTRYQQSENMKIGRETTCAHKDATNREEKRRILTPWTSEQKKFAQIFFKFHIKNKKPPKKLECEDLKKAHPKVFENKTWPQIKIFVVNNYNKK